MQYARPLPFARRSFVDDRTVVGVWPAAKAAAAREPALEADQMTRAVVGSDERIENGDTIAALDGAG